jgi:hypothetical protein
MKYATHFAAAAWIGEKTFPTLCSTILLWNMNLHVLHIVKETVTDKLFHQSLQSFQRNEICPPGDKP